MTTQIPFQLGDLRRNSLGGRRRDIFGMLLPRSGDPFSLLEARKQVACYFLENLEDDFPRTKTRQKVIDLLVQHPSLVFDKYRRHRSVGAFYSPLTMLLWEQKVPFHELDPIYEITNDRNYQRRFLDRRFSMWRSTQELLSTTVLDAPVVLADDTLLYVVSKVDPEGSTISVYTGVEKALLKRTHDAGNYLSWPILKALIDKSLHFSKMYFTGRRLLGFLHLLGYEDAILDRVASQYPQICDTIKLYWYEPERKPRSYFNETVAKKVERLILHRNTKTIDSDPHGWDANGWNYFMASLTKCASLQSLRLCLPTGWLQEEYQVGYRSLKHFFQHLPSQLEHFSLGCGGPDSQLFRANDACLWHIVAGLQSSRHKEGPVLKRLHLFGFDYIQCQTLDALGQFVGVLEFGAAAEVPDRPFIIGGMAGPTVEDMKLSNNIMNSSNVESGLEIWRAISRIPNHNTWGTIKARYAFRGSSKLRSGPQQTRLAKAPRTNESHLSFLHIDTGGYQPIAACADATDALVVMLKLKTLKVLALAARSMSFGRIAEAMCFLGFRVTPVFQALQENSTLKKLVLHGLSFHHNNSNTFGANGNENNNLQEIPSLLLKALENNKTLQELSAFDSKAVFTIFQGRPFHGYHYYADYDASLQIQLQCWLNKHGAKRLGDPGITRDEFGRILIGACRSRQAADAATAKCLEKVATLSMGATASEKKFSHIFSTLRYQKHSEFNYHQRLSWSHAQTGRYHADTLSILYGTLRACPSVWSTCQQQTSCSWYGKLSML